MKVTTTINNSQDMRKALNENLHGLLVGTRKPPIVKEVNNTLGKMLSDVKMEMMQNALVNNNVVISWFGESNKATIQNNNKSIGNKTKALGKNK